VSTHGESSDVTHDVERRATFTATGPVLAIIATRSGDIAVRTGHGQDIEVTLTAGSSKHDHLLGEARVYFDAASGQLEVKTQPRDGDGSSRGRGGKLRTSWFELGGSDLDVQVVVPQGSSLEVKSVSGDVALLGPFDDVEVKTVSGDVAIVEPCTVLDVHTASGDVSTGPVLRSLRCRSASGDVECLGTATSTEIMSASGDARVTASQAGRVVVKVVSGDVNVKVARGLVIDIDANTLSGDLSTNIDLDASGDLGSDEDQVFVKVTSVSGDIRVDKFS
jgi:DUF4097 and DUF4098 domain-containing protein YvlB